MRLDLNNPYNEGMNNLRNWRARYTKTEYPFKVVLNIFFRQYSMNSIWLDQIDASFAKFKNTEANLIQAFQNLENAYSKVSEQYTVGNTLIDLMNQMNDIGGLNYRNNIPLINKGQSGDNKSIEELEFTYIYYLLCNKSTLMWAAYGRKGYSKLDAIAQITGVIIEYEKAIEYATILEILGKLGVSATMNKIYSPLNNLF
jgi:hypothetical protein